jgi:hypothetical protein
MDRPIAGLGTGPLHGCVSTQVFGRPGPEDARESGAGQGFASDAVNDRVVAQSEYAALAFAKGITS